MALTTGGLGGVMARFLVNAVSTLFSAGFDLGSWISNPVADAIWAEAITPKAKAAESGEAA